MRALLPLFNGPSRYLGSEPGSVHKKPEQVEVRMALAFPDLYEVGMSYLGQKILYGIINDRKEFWAERVFTPSEDVAQILRDHDEPLCTMESDTPLKDMDVVGFHVTHELCYTNILFMLELGGIPIKAAERAELPLSEAPLVMAGGGCTFNAEPIADFMDFMILGDGEEVQMSVLDLVGKAKRQGMSRREVLEEMRHIPGVYVPAFFESPGGDTEPKPLFEDYTFVEKAIVEDMEKTPFPTKHIVPFAQPIHDRFAIEIARGCTRGCRFCQAGVLYRPARERDPHTLDALIQEGLASTGFEDLSFLSLSTGDYSALEHLFEQSFSRCRREQIAISLPSLRVGSVSERIMELMASIRRTGATVAPEAGSQRLRDVINKGVTEEGLLTHAKKLFDNGWQNIKLYFMLGLPTETFEDLDAIVELCEKVRDVAGKDMKRLQVTAAVSPFVPKPHTAFQWERQLTMDEVRERVQYLRDKIASTKRIKLRWHMPEMSFLEGIFSRGDRRLAPVVEAAYRKGALFASWTDKLRLEPWLEAMEDAGLEPLDFLAARDENAPLPWDHLHSGVRKKYLQTELKRAREVRLTPDCRYHACRNCGVCNMDGRKTELERQGKLKEIHPRVVFKDRDQCDATAESNTHATTQVSPHGVEPVRDEVPVQQQPKKGGKPKPPSLGKLAEKAAHYRIWHTKLGLSRFVSQVEMQLMLERVMRRARIPVSFSAGFHPLPRMSFGMALPVGVESEQEWFNLFLREPMEAGELARRLSSELPAGFDVVRIEPLSLGKKQPQPVVEDFVLNFLNAEKASQWIQQWNKAMEQDEILWTRETKKGPRTVDIRKIVGRFESPAPTTLVLRFDWRVKYVNPMRLILAILPDLQQNEFLLRKVNQWMEAPTE
ncbi:TIGR03960 family B12-binding radical SAM protein [Desulfobaculum bizertense]|uniref:TIGR03960 family B12-binding radical SAM protein n=1 Tax=Desulfobaculum bizertense TaxID=376490 RepID=UPI001F24718A|nr:TIGR03960 family B12-binding radical SAM protein [Desulfobaculum bizertense]UIJ37068.1 TIGR03960 family B12-binding radical SAM protein [Desulfobaculum bizertense]